MDNGAVDNVALAKKALSHTSKESSKRQLSDFQPFFDSLADDVVLKYVAPEGTPVSGEFRGKQAVIEFLTVTAPQLTEGVRQERPLEFVGGGERVVVLGAESYTLKKNGVTARKKEFAIVLTFRKGLIGRIVQIKDLSELVAAYRN